MLCVFLDTVAAAATRAESIQWREPVVKSEEEAFLFDLNGHDDVVVWDRHRLLDTLECAKLRPKVLQVDLVVALNDDLGLLPRHGDV